MKPPRQISRAVAFCLLLMAPLLSAREAAAQGRSPEDPTIPGFPGAGGPAGPPGDPGAPGLPAGRDRGGAPADSALDPERLALLAALARASDLAGPLPGLDLTPPVDQDPPPAAVEWKSSLNLGATYASGNTSLRTANFAADAARKSGLHVTTLKMTWNYSEQKDDLTKTWGLDQRRTTGVARHQKFFTKEERAYAFAAVEAENNYNQNVDLRFIGTVGLGHQVIKEKDLKVSVEVGAGYFSKESRAPTSDDQEFVTGRAGWDVDWQINETFNLQHGLKYFFSLEDDREMYGEVNTRLRATLGKGMFAEAKWTVQWDNAPSRDAVGNRPHSVDHLVLLSVGFAF